MTTIPLTVMKAKAQAELDATYTTRCIRGEKVFYYPDTEARVPGHIYSERGVDEFHISRCCEFHFDKMFPAEDEENEVTAIDFSGGYGNITAADTKTDEPREHPMPGQVLMNVNRMTENYEATDPEIRTVTSNLDEATVVTSLVEQKLGQGVHKPILDVDIPVKVIPSTTEGHNHLYIDKELTSEQYFKLLDALADAGIIERGYANVSKSRGYTAVRMPWVKKGDAYDIKESHTRDPWAF
jgi:hypothetical protein